MRNDTHIRQHEILCVLADGKSQTIDAFEEIRLRYDVIKRTIRRDLTVLESIPPYRVYSYIAGSTRYWKCDLKLNELKSVAPKFKRCTMCRQLKELEIDFHSNRANGEGYNRQCKACSRQIRKDYVRRHYAEVLKRNRDYRRRQRLKLAKQRWASK